MQLSKFDWDYVWNSFWIIIVDMTSVGYGDFVPITNFGRIIIGIAAIGGGAITSLIYIIFLEKTSFDTREEKAYERLKAHESKKNFRQKAMKCISLSLQYNLRRIKTKKNENQEENLEKKENFLVDIQNNVKDFSLLRKTITDFTFSKKIVDIIRFLKEKLNNDFDYVISCITIIDFFGKKIELLKSNGELLLEYLSNFEDILSQSMVSLQYLQENVMNIFALPNFALLNEINPEKNHVITDLLNCAEKSLQHLRSSISIPSEVLERPRTRTIDLKILGKIEKNKFITLKKMKPITLHSFRLIENHPYFTRFLKEGNKQAQAYELQENLALSNIDKQKNIMELSLSSDSLNSKLEFQRKSLAYRISVISEGKGKEFDLESRHSSTSEDPSSRKSSIKKNVVKRFQKKS